MRCCKDLGIASELWDPHFIHKWKADHAISVWCEHQKSKERRLFWRKASRPGFEYPWREVSPSSAAPSSSRQQQSYNQAAPTEEAGQAAEDESLPAAAFRAASKRAAAAAVEVSGDLASLFNPKGIVPPLLKKFAGQTWEAVTMAKDGAKYLDWILQNVRTQDMHLRKQIEAAHLVATQRSTAAEPQLPLDEVQTPEKVSV